MQIVRQSAEPVARCRAPTATPVLAPGAVPRICPDLGNAVAEHRTGNVSAMAVRIVLSARPAQRVELLHAALERRMHVGRRALVEAGVGDRDDLAITLAAGRRQDLLARVALCAQHCLPICAAKLLRYGALHPALPSPPASAP